MKKRLILLTTLFTVLIVSCTPKLVYKLEYDTFDYSSKSALVDNDGYTLIDFYALNDFHGALSYDEDSTLPGISKMNTFLKGKRNENPGGTVLIANGDMWQGSADSNLSQGKMVTHALNHMTYDAFIYGNHEFDWKIDTIKSNKEISNFPYLGANIIETATGEVADFVDDSLLFERGGVKIGIIGTIGSDLERTVQASLIAGLQFDKITDYVVNEAADLREKGAQIIVLASHDTWISDAGNTEKGPLITNKVVDAIFTGHQHAKDEQLINGIPILQARAYGRDVQHVQFGYHKDKEELKLVNYEVIENIATLPLAEDETTKGIFNYFYEEYKIGKIKNEVLTTLVNEDMTRSAVANLIVEVLTKKYNIDGIDYSPVAAMHNVNGGVRNEFKKGEIRYEDVYSAFPFDNEIYLIEIRGARLKEFRGGNFAYYWSTPQRELVDNEYYYIATTNFVYELADSPFRGDDFENTFEYPRDILATYLRGIKTLDGAKYK